MKNAVDAYQRMLADMDRMLAADKDRNERALLNAVADLGRVGRAGQRLADYLAHIANTEPSRREAITTLIGAWNQALNK